MTSNQVPGLNGTWIKASRSSGARECVQMRRSGDAVEVRDSKNPAGEVLRFTPAEFAAWVDGASKGEFSHLADS